MPYKTIETVQFSYHLLYYSKLLSAMERINISIIVERYLRDSYPHLYIVRTLLLIENHRIYSS